MKTNVEIATVLYLQKKVKSTRSGFDTALINLGITQNKKLRRSA